MYIQVTEERRGEIERIQREFANQLSNSEILRATAQGVNSALAKSIPRINKAVKAQYNITQKYLSRMAKVSPKANSGTLYGGIRINDSPLPLVAFRPKQKGPSIQVAIHKGKTMVVKNAFLATMASGHIGVFSRGRYAKGVGFMPGREKTLSGKTRITELRTASVFTMGLSRSVAADVQEFMGNEAMARTYGILQRKVDKVAKAAR